MISCARSSRLDVSFGIERHYIRRLALTVMLAMAA
jgi:hypothetical protein